MTQALTKSDIQTPALRNQPLQEVIASDVLIPRLLLMQGISPLVTARKAQLGDIVRSTTGEKLGNPDKPVDIVPIKLSNTWTNFEVVGQKGEFRSQEPRTAANETLPWEYARSGTTWQRKKTVTLFALLPQDVAAYEAEIARVVKDGGIPDLNKTVLPVVITFMSTSFKWAGKKCSSFFNTLQVTQRRVPSIQSYDYVLPLLCKEEKGVKGTYYVYDFAPTVPLKNKDARKVAAEWASALGTMTVRTDDTGEVVDSNEAESSDDV